MDAPQLEHRTGRPHRALAPFVASYTGYRYEGFEPGTHVGLPSRTLTFIVTVEGQLDLAAMPDGRSEPALFDAMVAGLHAGPAVIRHDGNQFGVQLDVTPAGARALFGMPAGELASAVEPLDVVLPGADELVDRVRSATSWAERFAAFDAVLLSARCDAPEPGAELTAAWHALEAAHGDVTVEALARGVGWSRRHLSERFTREFGVAPKTAARVMRFERARRMLARPCRPTIADVAAMCGFADQSHLTRDWHRFAGCAPAEWLAGEQLPFVQDADRSTIA